MNEIAPTHLEIVRDILRRHAARDLLPKLMSGEMSA